ncbi:STAS domain-containing protein [Streptomyces sp. NPDC007084]|uniref:STAS domain-containing protein n=1 Tax=Streptomyces sp. NPDC007084 TaxID=3154313 RepID=UPI003451226A
MRVRILNRSNGRATVFLEGDIDLATVSGVYGALAMCAAYGVTGVDVDLSAVRFCDASGLNAFLGAAKWSAGSASDVRLHRPVPAVRRLLDITGTGFLLAGAVPGRTPRHDGCPPSSDAA